MASGINIEPYGSWKVGLLFVNNKAFFMFPTADVSSTIDFSKAVLEKGVVDNLPSKDIR